MNNFNIIGTHKLINESITSAKGHIKVCKEQLAKPQTDLVMQLELLGEIEKTQNYIDTCKEQKSKNNKTFAKNVGITAFNTLVVLATAKGLINQIRR